MFALLVQVHDFEGEPMAMADKVIMVRDNLQLTYETSFILFWQNRSHDFDL